MTTPAGSAETNLPQAGPSSFDQRRPPERDLLDDCVHCGFCLPTCPTYQLWGEEMDSPRGRIYLMDLAHKGEIPLEGAFTEHIDACLGCMACVTACPSGVQYDRLLESVRPQVERNVERAVSDRLFRSAIFALFPYRRRLLAAALPGALYQRLRRIPAVAGLAEKVAGRLAGGLSARPGNDWAARPGAGSPARLTDRSSRPADDWLARLAARWPAAGSSSRPAAGSADRPAVGWSARLTDRSSRLADNWLARLAAHWPARPAAGSPARRTDLFARLAAVESLLPPVSVREAFARLPVHTAAVGQRRGRVALLSGCVQDVFFHRVNVATVRVLAAEGYDVLVPRDQQCCGALELHAGREDPALARARRTIARFETLCDSSGVEFVVTNVAGCGSSMKEYGHLLGDDPQWADRAAAFSATVRDVHEVLADGPPRAPRHPVRARVAYHDACHLGHAQNVRAQPRAVLRTIPDLELVDLPEAELCCGSAGVYNLVMPEAAAELGARKAANVRSVAPDVIVTANPGCLLQIGRHLGGDAPPLLHPVQLLDASIRGTAVPRR